MHILVLPSWYPNFYKPALGSFFKQQAELLQRKGNVVGVIAIQPINIKTIFEHKKLSFFKGFDESEIIPTFKHQYLEVPKIHSVKEGYKLWVFKKWFKKYVLKHGWPDIIHLHSFLNGELARWIKNEYGIPFVVTEHYTGFARGALNISQKNMAQKVFYDSSVAIAVSNEFSKLLEGSYNLPFQYIPNIVDTEVFKLKNKSSCDSFVFTNIAYFHKKKNQLELVRAFALAFADNNRVKLNIVGGGSEYKNLCSLVKDLNLESQVTIKGSATKNEVIDILRNSDAFVLSSEFETFGVVIIEAMSCGLPCIATKCGGPESIITSENLGILCEKNRESLSSSMLSLYENYSYYSPENIRRHVKENFSEDAVYSKLINVYSSILEEK
ncbi:glycosyltransferase [Vibrio sp. OPT20]|uniref:glycosyltransferase n=1 Tax=Vibrio sp. OPT20 TaxID=2778642 RepID=UPI00187EC8F5|nr:glycosyltransferase [Vibrio sp. OPT20]MBE8564347.1 glycosyltransferase [Vibrio sp. OPT20]